MSKSFYILLLIEFIKNNVNIYSLLDNITNNSSYITPIEINKTFNNNHSGIELNISSFGDIQNEYLFFYYNFESYPIPKMSTFRLLFEPLSKNYSINNSNTDVKCIFVNINVNLSDINFLNNISQYNSNCIGAFDKNNESKYEGIFRYYNDNNLEEQKQKIIFIIKNDWNYISEIKIYLRNNIYNLTQHEGIIKEKEEYTLIPYYFNLSEYINITNEIIIYSSLNNLKLYYLNDYNSKIIPSLLYQGNIVILYTNKDIINVRYNNIDEMFLITDSFNNRIHNYFEIIFNLNKTKINYYYFNKDNFLYNNHINLQMIEQNQKYCSLITYQNDNDEQILKELYIELIYGKLKTITIYNDLNYTTWDELLKNGKNIHNNESFYILNSFLNNTNINFICVENKNIPSMLHFYYTFFKNDSSLLQLSPGETYIYNLKSGNNISLNINGLNQYCDLDISLHIFNNEGLINIEVDLGNGSLSKINKNSIEDFIIKIEEEKVKEIKIYNKGDYNCRIIIKIGLQINENEDTKINNILYNSKYNLYYFKFPKLFEQYKYSKIYINIHSENNSNLPQNGINKEQYLLIDNLYNIIYPNYKNNYNFINNKINYENYSYFEIINPLRIYNEGLYDRQNTNYYIIVKPYENTKINIKIDFEKYDFEKVLELNSYYTLSLDKDDVGFIIPNEKRIKSYIQMFSCEKNKSIKFQIYDNFYKNEYTNDTFSNNQFKYYPLESYYIDSSISFIENNGGNIFINHFSYSNALNESLNKNFAIEFNNKTNGIHLIKPINGTQVRFNYTLFLDKKGKLLEKNINLCQILSASNLNELAYYINNITDVDFVENEYKLNFSSEVLKNYKSFDMLIYAKEIPYGMHFLSEIISNQYIEEKKAIIIENIFQKNNEKLLYYIGKMEKMNYYKINTNNNYEILLTLHFGNNFDINKIYIDCAQIKSDLVKDIIVAMSEQKNKEICKILDIKNNNEKIINIFVKMIKNSYNSLAIRIINEMENTDIAIYMDIDNLSINKEIIIDEEEENKLINIHHPFCFKYYKIYLDDITNYKYNQIGLYSQVNNSITILINNDMNEKIVIDYGSFIIVNTNDNYIMDNYNNNKELIVIIGDNTKQVLNITDIDIEPMKLNIIGLTKKFSNEKKNKINIIDYYSYNNISNINEIFVPLYINKCDNSLNNFIVLNIKHNTKVNNNYKKYIKINLDYGDIQTIEYSNILDKEYFTDEINNLITLNLKEKNLILLENSIYIFKIVCKNYLFMNINGYEVSTEKKKDNYILKSGSILNIPLNSQETTNINLNELKNSNLTKIELSNEQINFNVNIEINGNELVKLDNNNRILMLELNKKEINTLKIIAKEEKGYIQILTNINNNELVTEENDNYLSYNNRELYIYSHKIEPNNDLIKISIPIINKDKSKYISVCYYLSQIIIKNKKIQNCFTISENSFENITIINPYNINNDDDCSVNIYKISSMHIIFYKNGNGNNNDNKLELREVIIEEEGKNNNKNDNENNNDQNLSTKVGRVVLIIFTIIIVLIVIFFVFIYIKKTNIKKREMNYQASVNNENELLLAQGINSPLSLND